MNNHEIHRCSPSRWLQPDPTLAVSQSSLVDGSVVAMTAEDWFEFWQSVRAGGASGVEDAPQRAHRPVEQLQE